MPALPPGLEGTIAVKFNWFKLDLYAFVVFMALLAEVIVWKIGGMDPFAHNGSN